VGADDHTSLPGGNGVATPFGGSDGCGVGASENGALLEGGCGIVGPTLTGRGVVCACGFGVCCGVGTIFGCQIRKNRMLAAFFGVFVVSHARRKWRWRYRRWRYGSGRCRSGWHWCGRHRCGWACGRRWRCRSVGEVSEKKLKRAFFLVV
jgi:hypothetical protein